MDTRIFLRKIFVRMSVVAIFIGGLQSMVAEAVTINLVNNKYDTPYNPQTIESLFGYYVPDSTGLINPPQVLDKQYKIPHDPTLGINGQVGQLHLQFSYISSASDMPTPGQTRSWGFNIGTDSGLGPNDSLFVTAYRPDSTSEIDVNVWFQGANLIVVPTSSPPGNLYTHHLFPPICSNSTSPYMECGLIKYPYAYWGTDIDSVLSPAMFAFPWITTGGNQNLTDGNYPSQALPNYIGLSDLVINLCTTCYVPEPGTVPLIGIGLVGILLGKYRRMGL